MKALPLSIHILLETFQRKMIKYTNTNTHHLQTKRMANTMSPRIPFRVKLFTHTRTASNLLCNILNLEEENSLSRPLDQNPLPIPVLKLFRLLT